MVNDTRAGIMERLKPKELAVRLDGIDPIIEPAPRDYVEREITPAARGAFGAVPLVAATHVDTGSRPFMRPIGSRRDRRESRRAERQRPE